MTTPFIIMIAIAAIAVGVGTLMLPAERCDVEETAVARQVATTRRRRLLKRIAPLLAILLSSVMCSCSEYDDDINNLQSQLNRVPATAAATYIPEGKYGFYFNLDSETIIEPVNGQGPILGDGEHRCFVRYLSEEAHYEAETGLRVIKAQILSVDTIFTKLPKAYNPDMEYGTSPISGLYKTWPNLIADGYLTLLIGDNLNGLNLITGVNPDDPMEVELRYDSTATPAVYDYANSTIAFNLSEVEGLVDGAMLKIKYIGYEGVMTDSIRIHLRGGLPLTQDRNISGDIHPILPLN